MKPTIILATLAALALAAPAGAQGLIFQQPPSSPQAPGYGPAGPGQFGPGSPQSFPSPSQFPAPQPPVAPPTVLPPGVDQLFALEGNNTLLAFATPEGYERVRELVRNLDGDLDIVQTKVVRVDARTSDLAALGVNLRPDSSTVTGSQAAVLLQALQTGRLSAADTLRITTRENTAVDALLHAAGARHATGGTPFSVVPRVTSDGAVSLEILQPLSVTVSARGGQTAVVLLPTTPPDTTHLLFLTPSVLASDVRGR